MNSKAIKRQLLAAIAMVLVAAIALGSSTYAWFVASGTVEATGMKVQAISEGGLAISCDNKAWGTTADAKIQDTLKPASTFDMTEWYRATAASASNYAAADGTRKEITSTVLKDTTNYLISDNANGYVAGKEFKIRSTSTAAQSKGLYIESVEVTGAAHQLSTALRVGVLYKTASGVKSFVFGPVNINKDGEDLAENKARDNYDVFKADGTKWNTVKLAKTGKDGTTNAPNSVILDDTNTIPADTATAIPVEVFVWYEGEDSNLYSDQYNEDYAVKGIDTLSVTVKFSSISTGSQTSANPTEATQANG